MATSPNYGWAEPDNTDLVKNGALAIRTLGNAIDTSVWNVGFGQAGKNKVINGGFDVWQRGTSFSQNEQYTADRWFAFWDGSGARTISQQTFTPGAAPVAGYEGKFFYRYNQTSAGAGGTYSGLANRIEDVRTLAGQPVTLSFWAKAASPITLTSVRVEQVFGSGGSGNVVNTLATSVAITTSWVRYSYSITLPSISGKTIGTNSLLSVAMFLPVNSIFTLDLWGVSLEYGSKATPFQTASGGSIQGELAMCQRYYNRYGGASNNALFNGTNFNTTSLYGVLPFPVQMRVAPTITASGTADFIIFANNTTYASNNFGANEITTKAARIEIVSASLLIQGQSAWVQCATGNKFIETSAEL
jgi:hypothetical protein